LKSIPNITIHQVSLFRSDFHKYFPVKSKSHNQESIDQIELCIRNKTIIPTLSKNRNPIYKYHHITSKFE